MPMIIVQSLMKQIAPVSSEERMEYLTDTAVASGNAKAEFVRSHQRSLVRHTKPQKRPASLSELAAMGIQVDV